jgi:hypothetical protein
MLKLNTLASTCKQTRQRSEIKALSVCRLVQVVDAEQVSVLLQYRKDIQEAKVGGRGCVHAAMQVVDAEQVGSLSHMKGAKGVLEGLFSVFVRSWGLRSTTPSARLCADS